MPKHIKVTVYGSGQVKYLMPHQIAGVRETFYPWGLFDFTLIHLTGGGMLRVRERQAEMEGEAE